ncbi:unnamed protein product, partial [Owenia fusiformis]
YLFCCCGHVINVYSTLSGECVRQLRGHTGVVTSVVVNPHNKLQLYSSSLDSTVIEWDYTDGVILKKCKVAYPIITLHAPQYQPFLVAHWQHKEPDGKHLTDVVHLVMKSGSGVAKCELLHGSLGGLKTVDQHAMSIGGGEQEILAYVSGKKLYVYSFRHNRIHTHHLNEAKKTGVQMTCVAVHPTERCIATGCSDGRIYLWFSVCNSQTVTQTKYHWHSLACKTIAFTNEGSYMLSGGHECVLVKWQSNSNMRDYMPRLGAPINYISCSPDNNLYAVCMKDNVVQLISNNFKVRQIYQGLTAAHMDSYTRNICPAGLIVDPRTKSLVLNGKPGHLQFYSLQRNKHLYNLDIVCQNYISPASLNRPTFVTEIENAAFDSLGNWLATVERRDDRETTPEIRLKFYEYISKDQSFVLNTTIDLPHQKKVSCMKFRPTNQSEDPTSLLTTSEDGKFKIWQIMDDTDIYRNNVCFNCDSVGFYKELPAGAADFSDDGSVLAVAFKSVLTVWDPDTNGLKMSLTLGRSSNDVIRHVVFGNETCSHLVVCTTQTKMSVCNMLSFSLIWEVLLDVSVLIADPKTEYFAAFNAKNSLFVFKPSSSTPEYIQQNLSDSKIIHALFVEKTEESTDTLPLCRNTDLYFMNAKQELLSLTTKASLKQNEENGVTEGNLVRNLPQTPYSRLLAQKKISTNVDTTQRFSADVLGNPSREVVEELTITPAHVLPNVRTLCAQFIKSLTQPGALKAKMANDDVSDDENDEDDNVKNDDNSDSESDMEVDKQQTNTDNKKSDLSKTFEDTLLISDQKQELGKSYTKALKSVKIEQFTWLKSE